MDLMNRWQASRRQNLYHQLNDGEALILFAGSAPRKSADAFHRYFANRNFYYLTGILQSESVFLAVKSRGSVGETLFVHPKNPMAERWHGARFSHKEAAELSCIANIQDLAELDATVRELLSSGGISALWYDLDKYDAGRMDAPQNRHSRVVTSEFPTVCLKDVYPLICAARTIKDAGEIAHIREALAFTRDGIHAPVNAELKRARPAASVPCAMPICVCPQAQFSRNVCSLPSSPPLRVPMHFPKFIRWNVPRVRASWVPGNSCLLFLRVSLGLLSLLAVARGDVTLPEVLGSQMVLQSGEPVKFWGWAAAGERVTIRLGGSVVAETLGQGKGSPWTVQLPPQKAGPIPDIEVSGANTVRLTDLMAGEVWLGGGGANMVMTLQKGPWCAFGGVLNAEREVAQATDSRIRLFRQGEGWRVCSPQTVPEFSGAAYFFARRLRSELGAPVGLILAAMGGTSLEVWTPGRMFEGDPAFDALKAKATTLEGEWGQAFTKYQKTMNAWRKEAAAAKAAGSPIPPKPDVPLSPYQALLVKDSRPFLESGKFFERRIRPLIPLNVKGVLWYHGETDARRAELYAANLERLIEGWRQEWGRSIPFGLISLAGAGGPEPWAPFRGSYALVREAQIEVGRKIADVGVVCAADLGEKSYTTHPPNKQAVGERAALWALAQVYGRPIEGDGPRFGGITFAPGKASVELLGNAQGLRITGPGGFELAGADRKFIPARAALQEGRIELTAPGVERPEALRYAFGNFPECTVYNGAGLPALPFRTDRWPVQPGER
jgi:sialate O-acetylesterase